MLADDIEIRRAPANGQIDSIRHVESVLLASLLHETNEIPCSPFGLQRGGNGCVQNDHETLSVQH